MLEVSNGGLFRWRAFPIDGAIRCQIGYGCSLDYLARLLFALVLVR